MLCRTRAATALANCLMLAKDRVCCYEGASKLIRIVFDVKRCSNALKKRCRAFDRDLVFRAKGGVLQGERDRPPRQKAGGSVLHLTSRTAPSGTTKKYAP